MGVFEAQPCACRSQWAEHDDIKFFDIGQRLPLPLGDLRKIYFTWRYCNKKICFIYNYNIRKSPRGKGKHCPMSKKTWYPRVQLTELLQHRVELQKLLKMGAPYWVLRKCDVKIHSGLNHDIFHAQRGHTIFCCKNNALLAFSLQVHIGVLEFHNIHKQMYITTGRTFSRIARFCSPELHVFALQILIQL